MSRLRGGKLRVALGTAEGSGTHKKCGWPWVLAGGAAPEQILAGWLGVLGLSWEAMLVEASLAGLRLSAWIALLCRVSLRVTAWWFAGGCRGLPWCPQALGCHPSWPWSWGTSTQDKTQVTTAVMLPLRRPDGGQSQPSAAMRNSPGAGQHHVVSDLGHPPSSDTSE